MKHKILICICLIITLLLQYPGLCSGVVISDNQSIENNVEIISLEQAELLSSTTIRYSGDDSGRWPGETAANTTHNVDSFVSAALPTAWLLQTTSSVPIGVIDSGIKSDHEDITGSYMGGATFGNVATSNGIDEQGHGTEVAGVITANGYNNKGSAGVCWNGNVKSLKTLSQKSDGKYTHYVVDTIEAIEYANAIGIKILNISLGKIRESNPDELAAITAFNGLIVCSAGNDAEDTDVYARYPSGYDSDKIIVVGALNETLDGPRSTSNYGATSVDVFAPGSDVYTTVIDAVKYDEASGTSFAAPFVTGLAALIWEADPSLSVAQVKEAIMNNTDAVTALQGKCVSGGKINAFKALRSVLDTKSSPRTLVGDINGDGIEDQVISGRTNGYLRLSVFLGKSDGSFEQANHTFSVKTYAQSDPLFIGDVNGDGYDDVVLHWVSSAKRQLMTFFGNQYGYLELNSDQKGYNSAIGLKYNTTTNPSKSFLKDVTGDGCADFVCHMQMNNGNRGFWVYKGISGGTGFNTTAVTTSSTNTFIESDPVFMEDVSGDGLPDLVVHWVNNNARQLLTYTSSGSGTFNAPVNLSTSNTHNPSQYPSKLMLGDTTGDGKADFVVMWKNENGKRCILQYKGKVNSAGNATFNTGSHLLTSTRDYYDSDPVYLEDVTGDNKKDVVVYWVDNIYRQMLVYKSTGTDFNEGVNCSTGNRDNSTYPSDHRFGNVSTANGGKDILFRWAHKTTQITYFQVFTSAASGQYNTPAVQTQMKYFPFYVYR